ncbi:MAG TPA: PspC domain-containing protein [Puia sp.]|jgi:phage shock protein PspC (stress-responsive transcriptional regulator)
MKKIININFHSRVIPIEESAYEILKQYIESLRKYFANEEGRDEIISDIENRFAELFSDRLKKDTTCITDDDVNATIASMGRPEDFDEEEVPNNTTSEKSSTQSQSSSSQQSQQSQTYNYSSGRGRLYRNADDKIIGGVCSGLANYFGIDPVVLRIVFVLLFGALFWVYFLLWIVVPSQSLQSHVTKRLYRSADDKIIAGVCGGLSSYFNIDVWIPRLIFALPLIIVLISGTFHAMWWNWDFGFAPRIISSSLGSTLFISYIILWIAVPVATTSAEKLEMRGERVDLNSIRNTVKEDMENLRTKAEKWGTEFKETAQQLGNRAKEFGQSASGQAKNFSTEAGYAAKKSSNGFFHVIGVLIKAFFLFIGSMIAIALFFALLSLIFAGVGLMPLKNFLLDGFWENFYAWGVLVLFLGIPVVAFLTWIIRRIMRVRSQSRFLGFTFGTLWVLGLICLICLVASIGSDFKSYRIVSDEINMTQPAHDRVIVKVSEPSIQFEGFWWIHSDANGWDINDDSLKLSNVKIRVQKSDDAFYHILKIRTSFGRNRKNAEDRAKQLEYNANYKDSILDIGSGFSINPQNKFRGQQIIMEIQVPENKKIRFDRSVLGKLNPFHVRFYNRNKWSDDDMDIDFDRDEYFDWDTDVDYIMNKSGNLESTLKKDDEDDNQKDKTEKSDGYRYKKNNDSITSKKNKDSIKTKKRSAQTDETPKTSSVKEAKTIDSNSENEHAFSPIYNLAELI